MSTRRASLSFGVLFVCACVSAEACGSAAPTADSSWPRGRTPGSAPAPPVYPSGDDAGDRLSGLPTRCTPEAPAPIVCLDGATPDAETRYCRDGDEAVGDFAPELRASCVTLGGGSACGGNRWSRAFLLDVMDVAGLRGASVRDALARIAARDDIHCQLTDQDREGNGIYRVDGVAVSGASEDVLPPFVLGPRRQTDALVRQLYRALPSAMRRDVAFVVADRVVQNPEAYLRYLRSRRRVVIAGSFVGIGSAATEPDWAVARHADELWKLRMTITLVHALGRDVADVVYAMGDSTGAAGPPTRAALEARMRRTLDAAGLGALDARVGWGADETILVGMARQLGDASVRVRISNPSARHWYDGMRTTREIVPEKLAALRLRDVSGDASAPADLEAAVLTRRPGGGASDWQAGDADQHAFDDAFLAGLDAYPPERRARLALVDARIFNGAWDARAVPRACDLLAYGSWGTFGNVLGATLAAARILQAAGSDVARRQLLVEAIAHDVFANGYEEAQRGGVRDDVDAELGAGTFKHFDGYPTASVTADVFRILNTHVAARLDAVLGPCLGGRRVRFTPQLWRTFESEAHLVPPAAGELFVPGVYRADLAPDTFDPTLGRPERLGLRELEAGE